jgi:hypothetical protein
MRTFIAPCCIAAVALIAAAVPASMPTKQFPDQPGIVSELSGVVHGDGPEGFYFWDPSEDTNGAWMFCPSPLTAHDCNVPE